MGFPTLIRWHLYIESGRWSAWSWIIYVTCHLAVNAGTTIQISHHITSSQSGDFQTSNISPTKPQALNVSRLVSQLPLPSLLKPGSSLTVLCSNVTWVAITSTLMSQDIGNTFRITGHCVCVPSQRHWPFDAGNPPATAVLSVHRIRNTGLCDVSLFPHKGSGHAVE